MLQVLNRGAHAVAWQPGVRPVLFSSSLAQSGPDTAWRGGIPICAPWFGAGLTGDLRPSHGPARISEWECTRRTDTATEHRLEVARDAAGKPAKLELVSRIQAEDAQLRSELTITNRGGDMATVEAALHSYFAVSDVTAIELRGLAGSAYVDKVADGRRMSPEPAIEFGALVDRVYDAPRQPIEIVDAAWSRTLRIDLGDATQAVVWNCGPEAAPGDMGEGEWRGYVCVESAVLAEHARSLAPGQSLLLSSSVAEVPAVQGDLGRH